jgi:hypothetical protein
MTALLTAVISSIITGGLALIGVIYTNSQSNKKVENQIVTAQAVTDTKIDNLTEEVKRHNNFAVKIPAIEQDLKNIHEELNRLRER